MRMVNRVKVLAGVSLPDIVVNGRRKFSEITEFVKNRETIQQLQVQIAALALDRAAQAPLVSRIRALEEANKRLSINPLIEAGEFSTIAENLTEADVAIREGRWADHLEKLTDRLPGWGATALPSHTRGPARHRNSGDPHRGPESLAERHLQPEPPKMI